MEGWNILMAVRDLNRLIHTVLVVQGKSWVTHILYTAGKLKNMLQNTFVSTCLCPTLTWVCPANPGTILALSLGLASHSQIVQCGSCNSIISFMDYYLILLFLSALDDNLHTIESTHLPLILYIKCHEHLEAFVLVAPSHSTQHQVLVIYHHPDVTAHCCSLTLFPIY